MKILDFGSVCEDIVYSVDHITKQGETQASFDRNVYIGGKGFNQALALSRAGGKVSFAGKLGKDSDHIKALLTENGVDTTYFLIDPNIQTGHAVIQNSSDGNNAIVIYPAANRSIDREMVDKVLEGYGKGDVILLQNEISEIAYIIDRAYEKGMKIVMNPSPYNGYISEYDLSKIYLFLINELEGAEMSGETEKEEMIHALRQKYPEAHFVLTLGENGSVYFDRDTRIDQKAYPVKTVDTTAAGDTFTGYFLYGYFVENDIEKALDTASRASAISVTIKGAVPSIPRREDVLSYRFEA